MVEPWFEDPNAFGAWFGAIGGTLCGLAGAVLGCCSYFVQRGQGKAWVVGGYLSVLALGVVSLIIGIVAVVVGQPYGIWYPFTLLGLVGTLVMGSLLPVILARYREAEQRKVDAEGLRSS